MSLAIELDHKLIDEARRVGGHRTPKAAVTAALKEYVKKHKRIRILELCGKIDYDPEYDYKAARARKAQ
jgi:Arc/MetJ family transcription regulator